MATKTVGYVIDLTGSAQVRTADGVIKVLNIGDTVNDRDLLITGDGTNVVITFHSGQRMQVAGNAEVLLDETVYAEQAIYTDEQVDEIAALQQAILDGIDLDELEATTVGNDKGSPEALHQASTYERDGREGEVETRRTDFSVDDQGIDKRFNGDDDALIAVQSDAEPEIIPVPIDTAAIAPVITVTAYHVVEESVSVGDVIATFNSSDADGDTLTHQIINDPGGYFSINGTNVELTAAGVTAINDDVLDLNNLTVEVEVSDGANSASASDTSNITRISDVPPVALVDSYTTDEDMVLTVNLPNDVLANDNDLDGDTLSVNTTPITDVVNGSLSLNADGTFTYAPNVNFNGSDSFVYEINDGNGGTAQATVNITINPAIDLSAVDDFASGSEDTTISSTVASNDNTTSGGVLTYAVSTSVSNGSLVFNSDGSYDYTPNANFNGTDSFTYTVTDAASGESLTQTVNLTVNPVADLTAADDMAIGNEDTATISSTVATNDSTTSGGVLTYAIDTGVSNGSLIFNSDGSYDYTPNANFNGTDSFTYTVTDAASGESLTQTVTLTVNPVTDLAANDDVASGNEDTTISSSVAGNDSTTSGGVLTYAVNASVSNGSLVFNSDGSYNYTPNANFNGSDSFTYTVTDMASGESLTQTVSLTVNPVTDLTANDDVASGNEDTTISASVAGNDSTSSGGILSYAVNTGVTSGNLVFNSNGSYDYTPNANFNGTDSFTYTVTDTASGESLIQTVTLTVNPVTDLTSNDDTASVNEDTTINSSVAGNDSTTSGGVLTYAVDTGVSNGSLVFNSNGSYDYTPNVNFNGTDSFTYTVTDAASGESSTQTVTLTVNPVIDLTAADDLANGNEDTTISSSVAANDSTTSGGVLSYAVDTGVSNGSLVFNSNGSYDYTPNVNFNGTDSFTYTVTDAASGESSTQTVTLTVNPVIDLTAVDDAASGNEDTTISSSVAANDSTTSGGVLSYAVDTGVSNGSLVFNSNGSYDYTPNANFNGTDSFTYTVTDAASGESLTQTVTLTVNPVVDLTATDDTAIGNEDTTISASVAGNDSTTSGGVLTYAVDASVSNGSLVFNSDGSYDYTPNANFNGTDSFTYTVTDAASGESLTQTVTLTVNPLTDLTANDDVTSGNEDTTISSSVAGNESTTSGGVLTYAVDTSVSNGSLVFNGDGSYDYTPNANFNGTDSFTYTVTDAASGESSTQTVTLTVNPVIDLTAADDLASGNEDTTINSSVAANDSTTSGGVLTYAVDTGVSNGSLVFNSDGSYAYTPNANFNGTDSFTYTVTDAASAESLTQTVTLTVNPVTDLTANDDVASGNEDTTISSTVAANDSTTSGGTLTFAVDTGVSDGTLVFNSDGSYDYTPNANFHGTDGFTYIVTDSASGQNLTQTVTITVNPVIDLTATDDAASGNEDTTISASVAGNDSTTSGGVLDYAVDTGVSNGSLVFNSDGSYDYTPNANFNGTDSFTYTVTDAASGESLTQTVSLTVNPVVDLTAADDAASGNEDTTISASVAGNDSTTSGGVLSYAVDTGVSNGSLVFNSNGSYDYTPNANFNGTDSFTYTVTDVASGESLTQTVSLTVNPVIDLTAVDDVASGNEDTTISASVAGNDSTTSGGVLTYAVDASVSNGSLVFNSDGSYDYTPNANFNGTDSFTYTVTDAASGESLTQTVTLTINSVTDLAANDDVASGNEDTIISNTVAANDSTTSGGVLTYAVDTSVSNGSLAFNSDGSYDYTPNANFNGTDSFTYTVTDAASGESLTQTVTLTVNPITDLTANNDVASGNEDTTISSSVAGNDSTTSGGVLTYAVDTSVSNGSLAFNSDGSYDYTPNANFNGADSFTYTVTDAASGESLTQTVSLTVNPVVDLTAADDAASGSEGSVISSSVAANDSTTSGGVLTYAVDTGVSNGSLVFNSDGSYNYTPNTNFNGSDSFTYTVTDGASGESLTQTVNLTINPVSDLTAADDTASGNEDGTISSTVAANDSTTSGGTLTFAVDTGVSNGTLVFNSDGSYDYTPNANYNGTDSFTYIVTDSASGESLTQTVTITINPVIDLTATDDAASGNEDATISASVAANDSTTSGGVLTYAVDTSVSNGSLVFNSDGSYDYTPNANFNGIDSFTYTVTDAASGESSTQTVSLTVNPVVDLTAADDSASGNEDTTISSSVAGNDSTTSGGVLTYAVDTGVSNGSLIFNSDGSYDYTPNANFNSTDSFTYTVTDAASGESLTQTVSLTVNPVVDLSAADDAASGSEDTTISASVAGNDSTTSGGVLTYAIDTGVSNGSLVFNSDGSYDYTPNANFNGTDSFTYTVTDTTSGESSTQTVSLTVNPVVDLTAANDAASGNEDTIISNTVAANDSTTSGGVLTYAVDTSVSNGSLVFNSDGSYDYTPNANINGTDSFTYTVTDAASGESLTQAVSLTVNPVVDLTAADDAASGSEDTTISASVAGNDSTTSGGVLTYAVGAGVTNGSLVFNSDGSYDYTPNANFNGTDSFTYTVTDAASGESSTQTVSLTVNPVIDLTAANDTASGNEDTTISASVAGNDSTTSGGVLSYAVDTGVTNGSLVFNGDGSYDYTPNANFNGTDSFTYTVTDVASGESLTQAVTLTVNPVTDLAANDDTASGNEDTTISASVAGNDSTTSGGVLTYAVDTSVSNGSLAFNSDGSFDYTPNANFNGTDSFTYTVTDAASGESSTQTVTLTVNPLTDLAANDDIASGNEDTTISASVAGNDSTTSGGVLSYAVDTGVTNGSLVFNSDGSYDYTPNANFNGTDSFTYTVTDAASGESLTQTVTLTVNPVVDLTAADDSASGNEDTTISTSVAGNDSTTSGGVLTYAVDTGVSNGSLVFNSDGSYDYTPNANFNGTDSFTYTVTDAASGESSTQTVSLTVNPVVDLTAANDAASGNEDTIISNTVAANDSTTSGGVLTYAVDTGVSNGSLAFNSDGSYDYTPNANFNGTDNFTYTVTDATSGESLTQTVTLTVNPVTDLTANDDTASGDEDTTISSSVAGNDSTTSGGVLTYAVDTSVSNGSLAFNSDGSYDYTPNANFNGTDSFTYTVTDAASGESSTQTVSLTVNPVIDLTAADDSASGNEDTIISSTVAANDSTTSGGVLMYAVDTSVSNGSLVFNSDGSYDYTPNANFNGTDSFTYTVTDAASGESLTQAVTLSVNPVIDLTANDDTASGNEDTTISSSVAGNDSTTSGGVLTYAVDTSASNGSLVFNSDGSYDYTPNANFNGTDSFTYTVTDAASGESLTQAVTLTVNPVTDLAANDDFANGNEDTTISSSVAGNDSTTSGGVLAYAVDTGVSNGSLVFNSDGSFDYTPNANFNGTDSFTYTVTDAASGESLTQTVSLTVNPVVDLSAANDAASGSEDTTISASVAGNDSTTSGGVLTYAVDTGVSNGSLVFNSDGSYDYSPNANFNGTDSFTYTVTDAASGESLTQAVTLTVNPVIDLTATDDTASGNEDTTISASVAGNDSTTSGGILSYTVDTGVSNGSLVFNSDGSYDYTPNANFNGTDSFTYTVTDAASGESSTQTVSLTVNPVVDLTAANDAASGNEDTTISASVAGNDSTTSGGVLTYAVDTGVSNGSLIFNSDGSYDYTPNANFNGTDSFTYTVTDAASGESLTQTVTLTVNPLTDLTANDDVASGNEDTTISSSVAGNDSTTSGGVLTYAVDTGVSNGSLVFNSDGSYDYTPNANFNGTDSFTYTVTDAASGESLTQTVTLTVNPVTDLAANDDVASGNEDTTISSSVAGNDSTTSGGVLTYAVDTGVSNGSLVFNGDGSYDYTPNANFNGTDSFTYTVTDAASGESLTQAVSLTVNPVVDLTAADDAASGSEDTTISASVAGNDSTTSGGVLTYAVGAGVTNGSLVFNSDGSYDYTPNANFNGTDSFTYTVTDAASGESSTQTVTLTVNPVTDLAANDDVASGDEDTTISSSVAGNDSTTSGGVLTYAVDIGVSNGSLVFNSDGSYDYMPNANFNGTDSFTYTVTDTASGESLTQTVSLTVNPVVDLSADNDAASGSEDTTISASVAGNDSTTSGGVLTYAIDTGVSNGSLVFNSDGSYDYTPNANFNGTDSFTYTVTDAASGESLTQTVTLTVNPVTDLAANDDVASGNEDTTISSSVAGNDSTTSGGVLTYVVDTSVSNGSLVFNSDGSYDYTPNANFNGTDSFTYTVTDAASGESLTQAVTLSVNPVIDLTANDDTASGSEDTTISASVAGNDSTTSGGVLTYAVDTGVSNGSLVFNSDGSYDYTPNANFNGTDSFTYTVTDAASGESLTQTVTLTVNPLTDLTANDDVASGNEDTTISTSVAANDSTTSGGVLTYVVDTSVSNGSLVFNSDGSYDYTPNANFNGTDSFTYTVTDVASGESSTQTVTLTVNPLTDLTANDDVASGDEDTTISASVAGNDSTTSGGVLTYAVDTGVSNGSLVFNSDGSYDYTSNANFNGTDSFTYTVTDAASGESSTQTVTLTINPVADLTATDDAASGSEDTTISASVASNDSTTSGGVLSYAVDTGVTNGSLVFNSDGSYDYTPNSNFNGTDSFTYTVTDAASGESSTQTVSLTVNPVIDLTAADDSASGNEDTTISSSVAGNDSTTSGGVLTYAVDTGVSNGSLVFNGDGSYDYTPNANFNGTDSFTYTVTDAASGESLTQAVSLTVNPVVDLTAADDAASGSEDTTISASVAGNDSTTSGGVLTYAVGAGVTNGSLVFNSDGSYDYTPNANFNGTDSFTYTVTDAASGESSTQNVTLTINPVADLTATDDTASGNEDTTISASVAANDSTTSGGVLTYAVDAGVSNGSLVFNSDGSYDYTPNANFNGTDSFTYTVTDVASGESSTQTVTLTVNPVVDLSAVDDVASGNEDTTISTSVAGNDSTTSGGVLTYAVDTGVSNGSLVFNSDGSYDYTPNANFNGTDSFTYTVTDAASGESSTQTVSLTVNPVTDLAANDDVASGDEDTTISSSVAGNDSTTSGSVLTYAVDTSVSNGSLAFNGDGSYDYTPNANFNGTDSFTYTVTDAASGESSTQTVTLTVNPVIDLTATDDTASGNEDTTISASVAGNDSTISGGVLSYAVDTGVTNGSLVFNSDGSYDYTPNANFNGTDSFTYTVTDAASGESSTQTVSLTVNPVADLTANDDVASGDEDTTISSTVAANDSTTSGGVLTYAVNTGASNGGLVFNSDGSYDYTPNANFNGTDSFTYTVTDPVTGEASTQTVSITVNSVDDAPTLDLDANNDSGAGGADYTTTFTEGGTAVSISDVDVSIADLDSTQIQSATITITNVEAGDLLNVGGLPVGITASAYDPVTGSLTLSGSASIADYQTAIRVIQFTNDGSSTGSTRSIEVSVSDGTSSSNVAVTTVDVVTLPTVSVTDVSVQEPVAGTTTLIFTVSLDQMLGSDLTFDYSTVDISALAGSDYVGIGATSGTIVAGATSTTITVTVNSDANNFEGDETFSVDLSNFNQAVNFASGSHLTADGIQGVGTIGANNGAPDAVDDSYITEQDTPLVISSLLDNDLLVDGATLTGFTQGANGTVVDNGDGTYTYTPTNPAFTGTDTFTYTLTDADGETDTATVTVTVSNTPVNPPVVTSVPDTAYTENDAPTQLLSGVDISDVDSTGLSSVVVRIDGYIGGQDSLTYLTAGTSVNGSVNVTGNTWELTLTGGADINEYESVLGMLEYENTSDNPSSATRSITVEAYDESYGNLFGADAGNLTITTVNDAPDVFDNNNFSTAGAQDNALNIMAPIDMDTDDAALVITVTGLPTGVGSVTLADGTPVNINDVLTLTELTSLEFDAGATDGVGIFNYTVFDGELTTVGTTTINVGSSEADMNTVYESALPGGTDETSGMNVATGNLFANDASADGSTTLDSVDFNSTNYTPDGSGIITVVTVLGTLTVYADNTNPGYNAGDYTYVLNTNDTTSADVSEIFTYNFTSGSPQQDTLTIDIIDDTPVANDLVETIPESEEKVFNIVFTLDDSGSMGWGAVTGSTNPPASEPTRMEIAQESLAGLAAEYFNQSTQVTVTLVTFNSSATFVGTYTDFTSFETALNSVTPGGGTNYIDATDEIETQFTADLAAQNPADDVQNVSYFISDGEANDGTSPVGSGYLGFVNDNSIDSYAVGIGSSLPTDLSDLNYIHNIDSLGVGNGHVDEALIVADISQLESELLSTVPTAFGGNIVANGSIQNLSFGADGGFVQSIEMDLGSPATTYTFSFDGSNITVSPALPTIEIDGARLTLNSDDGFDYGTFTFDFSDGSYSFVAPNGTAEATFSFDYTILDGDGDTATATATIDIVDDTPDARDDLHSVDAYDTAQGNVITAIGTDGGPSFGGDFTPFATQGGGVDKIVDDAVVTEFNYRGSIISLDLTLVAQPDPTGTSDDVAINSGTNFATTDITLSSTGGVSFNGNGAGVGGNSRLDSGDGGVPLTITFNSGALPYGVDNLVLTMNDYQGGNNDAVTLTLYDVSGNVLSTLTHTADNGSTIDLAGYSGIGSVDMAYTGGGFDAQLSNIAYDPAPAGFDTVPAGGNDGGSLSWVYNHETDLDGNDVFQATVTDSSDGSVFIMHSNGYYNFTPDQSGAPVDVSVDTTSQANVDASDLNIAIRAGGATLQYSVDGVGVQGGNGQLLSSGEALLVTFDAVALPDGVDNLVLTLNDFQSANTDQATVIVTHDTDGDGVLTTDTIVFSASDAGSETLDLSQFSGVTQFDIEYTGGGWDLGLGNVSYRTATVTVSTLQPELVDYTLTDTDGQSDTARLAIYTIDQIITGTVGADNIVGGSLNDAINGDSGDDILSGGDGHDTLSGGDGSDTLFGNAGNDYLSGGADNDSLFGGADNDYLDGDAGDDLVDGGTGDDIVQGGDGNDLVYGGAGNDKLEGEAGYDLLVGGAGDDSLFGGTGVDVLNGGAGNDVLSGGDDIDTFVWSNGDEGTEATPASDIITDFTVGMGGDVLNLADMLQGENTGNLTDYLHFESDGNGGTVINVDTDGGGTFAETQQITLTSVDLTAGGTLSDQNILDNLLADGNLIVD